MNPVPGRAFPRLHTLRARASAGVTLVELMIVVVIIGVLAAIAIPTYGAYVRRGRAAEATSMLQTLAARQHAYRSEFGQYCNVSSSLTSYWPASSPTNGRADFSSGVSGTNWPQVGFQAMGLVWFRYAAVAGSPPATPPGESGYSSSPNQDVWFVAQAYGDLDGDGTLSTFRIYSGDQAVRALTSETE